MQMRIFVQPQNLLSLNLYPWYKNSQNSIYWKLLLRFFRMLKLQSRISKGHWRTELLNRRTDKDVHADQMLSGSPGFRPDDLSTGVPITTSDVWKASNNDFDIRCIFFKNMFCSKAVEILCLCLMLNSYVFSESMSERFSVS